MKKIRLSKSAKATVIIILVTIAGVLIYFGSTSNNSTPLSPYHSWHTYCNHSAHTCFKYPKNWKSLNEHGIITFESSNNTEQISYQYNWTCLNNIVFGTTYTYSIDNLPTKPALSVVGIVLNNEPEYTIVNTNDLKMYGFQLSKLVSGNTNVCPYFGQGSWILATPNNTQYGLSYAKAWFNTQDAKTMLKILKSVNFN